MFVLTGESILAGAQQAAREQGIGTDGVSDKDRMAAIAVLDAAAEEGPEALAAAEAGIDPVVLASLAHLSGVPRSATVAAEAEGQRYVGALLELAEGRTVGLMQLGAGDLAAGQAVVDGATIVDDTPFTVQALNCYRQPIALDGQLHVDGLHVVGSESLNQAMERKTGMFSTDGPGPDERHRTFEFVVTGPTGVVHYRRTRGGVERVEAPPVTV